MTEPSRPGRFVFYDGEGKQTSLRVKDVLVERTKDGKRYCQIIRLPVSILKVYDTETGMSEDVGIPINDTLNFLQFADSVAASVGLRTAPYRHAKAGISAVELASQNPLERFHEEHYE